MIPEIGDVLEIDPWTEMRDCMNNAYVSDKPTLGIVTRWHANSDWQEIEMLVDGELLYLVNKWDKIRYAFRRIEDVNSDGRRDAKSIREGLDYDKGRKHKSL